MTTLAGMARREAQKALARRESEKGGGHYYVPAERVPMPDGIDYPSRRCPCGAHKLWPADAKSADAEREQERADHLRELAAEREMVQAQTPVVNVQVQSDFPQVERRE